MLQLKINQQMELKETKHSQMEIKIVYKYY